MAARLRLFRGKSPSRLNPEDSPFVTALARSFAPGPNDELPDLFGYSPRPRKNGPKPVKLTERQQLLASWCISNRYSWKLTIRVMFSGPRHLLSLASISPAEQAAAKRYLNYLWRNNVKVSACRDGLSGYACVQLKTERKRLVTDYREESFESKRRIKQG
jgi:hypothetical protein